MDKVDDKFHDKNKVVFEILDKVINDNRDIIRCLIASPEIMYLLGNSDNGEIISEGHSLIRYNNIRVLEDVYAPVSDVEVVYKKSVNNYTFSVPCICGYFKNEEHGNKLK